jgi:ubiquinone/menaquinone biosynthesis C-methylase UbiE
MINPDIQLGLARDRAEELRLSAAASAASRRDPGEPSRAFAGALRERFLRAAGTRWRSVAHRLLQPTHDKENLMATQDWTAHCGEGPARYQRLLVPAVFDPFARRLVAHARVTAGMRILDVACGTGAASRVAARAAGPTGSVVAVDISAPMLAIAVAHPPEAGAARIEYLEGRAEAPPVEQHAFDLVLCQQGLQFFADRTAALAAMRRALLPAGRLAIAAWTDLPTTTSFAALADALERHLGPDAGARKRQPWSLSNGDELRELAAGAGFEQIKLSTHIGTARFPRRDLARELVLATPLASEFAAAAAQTQQAILADVTDALSACEGRDGELCHPITANFLTAVAPNRVGHGRSDEDDALTQNQSQLVESAR